MLKLLIQDDEGKETVIPLIREEITIGRKEGNTIRLTERNVSRRHARLTKVNGSIFVEDVAARYGIKLNGSKIDGRAKFDVGDEVLIGDYKLRIQDDSKPKEAETHLQDMEKLQAAAGPQPIPPREQGRLVIISSNFAGQEFPLARTEMVIGRNADCDIIVDHRSISGTHAKVVRGPNGVFKVVDLKSSNGVRVNGQAFSIKELNSGDIIELGHVRARFCAPGELWSFQLAAGLMDDISPPAGRGTLIFLLAIIAVLVVGVAFFFAINKGDAPEPKEAEEEKKPGEVTGLTEPGVDSAELEEIIINAQDHNAKGEFEAADALVERGLKIDPDNKVLQKLKDDITSELLLKQHLDDAISYLAEDEFEFALIELESIDDETSWAARQVNKLDLFNKAHNGIQDKLYADASDFIKTGNIPNAQNLVEDLRSQYPESPKIVLLEDQIDHATKQPEPKPEDKKTDRPKKDRDKKRDKDKDKKPKEDKKEDKGGDDKAAKKEEAAALAKEAKRLILQNPSKAADLYEQALDIYPSAKTRSGYALALERAGKHCKAYKQYKKALPGLSGKAKERAQKGVDRFKDKCE